MLGHRDLLQDLEIGVPLHEEWEVCIDGRNIANIESEANRLVLIEGLTLGGSLGHGAWVGGNA